jgi:glycine cleavage system H protein
LTKIQGFEFLDNLHYYVPRYTWADIDQDHVRIGITDFGQQLAGKILFAKIRPKGTRVAFGRPVATIESAKWVGRVASPVTGTIVEINAEVEAGPWLINESPYSKGWLVKVRPQNLSKDMTKLFSGDVAMKALRLEIEKSKITKK